VLQNPRALPSIGHDSALFLDFDGTLVDLAPQPEAVRLPPDLPPTLRQLSAQLNGALAIVSGRRLADLDQLLAPLRLPVAAEHGAHLRPAHGELIEPPSPALPAAIREVNALARRHNGLRVEVKTAAVALHYRQAPELEATCLHAMAGIAKAAPGLELLHGKYVFEIKPAGVTKGTAIAAFMAQAPFTGRRALFAGDDVTDESGFATVQQLGGCGIKVGPGATQALCRCPSAAGLRDWLRHAAEAPEHSTRIPS
jgi:trehalose 6-phosphate phosphatase